MAAFYSITEILSVARIHPFYNPSCEYPPSPQAIADAPKFNNGQSSPQLSEQPLLHKYQLYLVTLGTSSIAEADMPTDTQQSSAFALTRMRRMVFGSILSSVPRVGALAKAYQCCS